MGSEEGFSPAVSCCLTKNFRSAPPIVFCGNHIISVLHQQCPAAIDWIQEEVYNVLACSAIRFTRFLQALLEGSAAKPLLLHAQPNHLALDELYSKLLMGSAQHRVTSLRHLDLAIVVRTAAARDRLKAAGVQATILTVMEAKGSTT